MHYFNHLPLAKKLAAEADVAWGGEGTMIANAMRRIEKARREAGPRRATSDRSASSSTRRSTAQFGKLKNLNRDYVRLRMMKSAEELDWFRIGAHFSDLGMMALRDNLRPGINERELGDAIERAYMRHGGTNAIHFIGTTSMAAPTSPCRGSFRRRANSQNGDVVFAEISANFWDYAGQVLRTFTVGAEPTQLYRDLHAAADAAFDAIVAMLKDGAMPADVVAASP